MGSSCFVACVALVTGVAGAGCSSSSSTPTSTDYDDVAQSTGALVATPGGGGEMGSIAASASLAVGVTPSNVSVNATGSFDGVNAGVTYDFTVACTDASGAALAHCGVTTNDAKASVTWSGDLTLPNYTATVNRTGTWTLTGIQSGTAVFSGTGSFSFASQFQSSFRNEQASANLSYSGSYDAVTYNEVAHLVTGGSVHYAINGTHSASSTNGASSGSFAMDAELTFSASGNATLTLDGSHQYSISASGTVTKI